MTPPLWMFLTPSLSIVFVPEMFNVSLGASWPEKVWKLNRLQHEVLHIYVHAYSAYKNKILRIHIVTIHTFIKMDLKTPWFSLWSICVLFWWKVKKNLGCFLPSEVNLWQRGRDIGLFSGDNGSVLLLLRFNRRNGHISAPGPKIKKSKDTFFSSTLKVWESKVSLFFLFMAKGPRYWLYFLWRWHALLLLRFKRCNDTFFSSSLKVWESKVSLFF